MRETVITSASKKTGQVTPLGGLRRCVPILPWRHHIEIGLLDRLPESIRTAGLMQQLKVKKEAWDRYQTKNERV